MFGRGWELGFDIQPEAGAKRHDRDGKSMSFSEVKSGDVITFWKSEKRLDARAMPAETAASWQVVKLVEREGLEPLDPGIMSSMLQSR
jgi:hypothetical protein